MHKHNKESKDNQNGRSSGRVVAPVVTGLLAHLLPVGRKSPQKDHFWLSHCNVLRRFYHMTPLGLYSSSGILSWRRSRTLRISALVSSFALVLLITAIIVPLYNKLEITEAATGTAKESSLSFNLTNSTANVDLSVNNSNGTFSTSTTPVSFNISTTNYTGYTLSIKGINNNQTLVNSTNSSYTLSSISTATESFNSTDYNNKWGYLPSKLNSSTNTSYLPAPTTTASTLDKTTNANSSANSYTIGIGARASYTTPAGEYTGTYILTAVANNIAYYIDFNDNTNDSTVANLPTAISSSVSTTSVTLPSTTPTRTGYTFKSWCLGTVSNNGTTCTGTQYNKSSSFGLDQTTTNGASTAPVNLYAVWTRNNVTYTLNYNANNGTGVPNSQSNTNNHGSYTFTLNTTTIPTRSGYNFLGYTATSSATTPTYTYTAGTGTNGANGTFSPSTITLTQSSMSSTAESTTLYAVWGVVAPGLCTDTATCMQTFTLADCQVNVGTNGNQVNVGDRFTLTDARDGNTYTVRYINGNCWMTKNLMFVGTNLDPTTTNITTSKTISYGALSSGNNYTEPRIATGAYYNYCAATAGTICTGSSSTEASQDVCPAGWKLPTMNQQNTIGSSSGSTTYTSTSAFNPVYSGAYVNGQYYSGTSTVGGDGGFWWSSTAYDTTKRYRLYYRYFSTSPGDLVSPGDGSFRTAGYSIRCVLK